MRKTIYISERRNKAIVDFIASIPKKDISYELVKLMEDGMKWRNIGKDINEGEKSSSDKGKRERLRTDFSDLKVERKKLSKDDLEKKLERL